MSVIQEFTVLPGQTDVSFRVQKSVQHLLIRRVSTVGILALGLLAGLPERISAEVTHPTRKRVSQSDRVPLSHLAAWGQTGRGPIVESGDVVLLAPVAGDGVPSGSATTTTQVHFYLNQNGPFEISTDDQYNVTISGLVAGAHYIIIAPDQPIMPLVASKFYNYEQSLILANDREKALDTSNCCGLIFPNRPEAIERVIVTYVLDEQGNTKDCEYTLDELLAVQADANPFYAVMSYTSALVGARKTVLSTSGTSDLLVVSLNSIKSVEIHTVLGQPLDYTLVRVSDRNLL